MFKIGLCQMMGSMDKNESMAKAKAMVTEAAENGAHHWLLLRCDSGWRSLLGLLASPDFRGGACLILLQQNAASVFRD